jgi:isopropylmalate/homocitrate/citramalate synthase
MSESKETVEDFVEHLLILADASSCFANPADHDRCIESTIEKYLNCSKEEVALFIEYWSIKIKEGHVYLEDLTVQLVDYIKLGMSNEKRTFG